MPLRLDRRSVAALRNLASKPVQTLRTDEAGRVLRRINLGEFWTPPGSTDYYVRLIGAEAESDVYMLDDSRIKDAIFLDCGANIGFITRMALDRGARQVIAFEPSPDTAACFRLNFLREIAEGRVQLIEKALLDKEDKLFLTTAQVSNPASHSLMEPSESQEGIYVPVTSIDRVVRDLNLPRVDFIKMDIEGAEVKALAGAAETIRKYRPYISLGTEHTDDLLINNEQVIEQIRALVPDYDYVCTEVHPYRSPARGYVLTPHSLYFSTSQQARA